MSVEIFKILIFKALFITVYLKNRTSESATDFPSTGSCLSYTKQPHENEAEAWSLEIHPGLPCLAPSA